MRPGREGRIMLGLLRRKSDRKETKPREELVVRTLLRNGSTNQLIVQISGDASSENAVTLHKQLEGIVAASQPSLLIVDVSGLEYINSDGLGVLVGLLREMRDIGGKLRVVAPRGRPRDIIDVARLTALLDLRWSLEAALKD
jgi:anti-sigma B factor antagonist